MQFHRRFSFSSITRVSLHQGVKSCKTVQSEAELQIFCSGRSCVWEGCRERLRLRVHDPVRGGWKLYRQIQLKQVKCRQYKFLRKCSQKAWTFIIFLVNRNDQAFWNNCLLNWDLMGGSRWIWHRVADPGSKHCRCWEGGKVISVYSEGKIWQCVHLLGQGKRFSWKKWHSIVWLCSADVTQLFVYRRPSLFAVLLFGVSTIHGLKNRT